MPVVIGKLDTAHDSAHPQRAFLFEPGDPVRFDAAWSAQQRWQSTLLADPSAPEAVWILQHQTCYTLGRGASEEHLHFDPADPPAPLYRIDRGGEVTHHLPGQLVAYPALDLQRRTPDLHWYLRQLEQVVLDVLVELGLEEARRQLDLIDHDFYLFREKESEQLQVIYRRNHGGYGVIQARE